MLEKCNDVLTVKELKEVLQYKSNTTVYKMLNEGTIKAVHMRNNKWLIPKENVINYLLDNTEAQCYNLQYILR